MKRQSRGKVVLSIGVVLFLSVLSLVIAEAAPVPKPEGTLTVANQSFGEEGFLSDRTVSGGPLWEAVYSPLVYNNTKTGKPIPAVAERWEYSKDSRSLTFFIRKDIQFHDGWGELTAEDVKFTIELNMKPTSVNTRASELRQKIRSMEVVDRYTLVIQFKEPDPLFFLTFEPTEASQMPIVCKKYIEKVGEEKANRIPIGSGPYRFVEQKLGEYAKFEALEKNWMLIPEFKYLILRLVSEETTRVAMLKTGEVDIAVELANDKLPEIEKAGLRTVVVPLSDTMFLPFGGMLIPEDKRYVEGYHRKDPWVDVRVREAMNIAIDRKAIAKSLYNDMAVPAPTIFTFPGWEKLEPIPYDPKRAKQLLAEAGYPNGFSFKLFIHAYRAMLPLLGQAAAGYWEAIGLKPEIIRGDYSTWRTSNRAGKTAGHVWVQSLSVQTDWGGWLIAYESPNGVNPFWQSEETKVAIKKVLPEADPQKREVAYKELARLYRSTYPHVPLVFSPKLHGVSKNVGEWFPDKVATIRNFIFARHPKPLNTWRLFTP